MKNISPVVAAVAAVGLASTFVVACGDAVTLEQDEVKSALVDETDGSAPADDGGGGGGNGSDGDAAGSGDAGWTGGGWRGSDAGTLDDSYVLTEEGDTCPGYTFGITAGGGPDYCKVAVSVSGNVLTFAEGNENAAILTGDTLHVQCKKDGTPIMEARIDCFQGEGEYLLPAGALMLGGQLSDRACRFGAYLWYGEIHGFISCDDRTGQGTNIFGSTGVPMGLGAYTLAQQ